MKRVIKINHWWRYVLFYDYFEAIHSQYQRSFEERMYRTVNLTIVNVYMYKWDYVELIVSFFWAHIKIVYRKWPLMLWFSVS